jgi:YbbR domain-containing protein
VDKRKDSQIAVKVISVVAAFILWLYIANVENPRQTRRITIPVNLVNLDILHEKGLALLPGQEPTVTLTLRGPATQVFKTDARDFDIVADLNAYVLGKGLLPVPVEVRKQPPNIDIMNVGALTVGLKFDRYHTKDVPVRVNIKVETKPGFMAFNPVPKPNVVYISGPEQYVGTVSYVQAEATQRNADTNVSISVPLKAYDEAGRVVNEVTIDPKVVDVAVPVKRVKSVGIKVNVTGTVPGDYVLKGQPEPLIDRIEIAGDDEVLKNITQLETEPLDLSTVTGTGNREIKLKIPNNIVLVNLSDEVIRINVNVEKINTRNFTVDIKYQNLGTDLSVTMDRAKANITVRGSESKLNNLSPEEIRCYVDLGNLSDVEGHSVDVNVILPEGFTKTAQSPNTVKVTITRRSAPTGGTPGGTQTPDPPPAQ